jgi:hypothetical protein
VREALNTLNTPQTRAIALQIVGAYTMNHIADVVEMLQDKRGDELDEETLITIEVQVKAIAEELIQQSMDHFLGAVVVNDVKSEQLLH